MTVSPHRPIPPALRPLRTGVRKGRLLRMQIASGGKVTVGANFSIGRSAQIRCPHFFRAGDDVSIGSELLCEADITIGSAVLISSRVSLIGNDHTIPPAGVLIYSAGRAPASHIQLEGDNLLGNGVTVLGSVRIGFGAVIGAGSLVLHDVPPNAIMVGRPAKVVRTR